MKPSKFFVFLMILGSLTVAGGVRFAHAAESTKAASEAKAATADQRALFKVEAISCGSCEARIRKELSAAPGVAAVNVSLEERTVTVDYAKGLTDEKNIAERISKAGYPAQLLSLTVPAEPLKARSAGKGGCGGNCCGAQPG